MGWLSKSSEIQMLVNIITYFVIPIKEMIYNLFYSKPTK